MNFCAAYSSKIMIYGRDLAYYDTAETVLGYAREAILSSISAASEYGVVRLDVDDELTQTVGQKIEQIGYGNEYASGIGVDPPNWGESSNADGDRFSPGAKFGLTISILALMASLVGFALYVHFDNKADDITSRARAEQLIEKSPFLSRLFSRAGSIYNRRRAKTDSNRYSDEVEPSLHIRIEDGKPVFTEFESSMSVSTKKSATGSSRSDDPLKQSTLAGEEQPNDIDSFLNEPNDVDSFLNEPNDIDSFLNEPNDVDSFLNDPGDAHSYLSSLADSVILPEDDPEDDMYLDAFRYPID
jgi:hypothetical protein